VGTLRGSRSRQLARTPGLRLSRRVGSKTTGGRVWRAALSARPLQGAPGTRAFTREGGTTPALPTNAGVQPAGAELLRDRQSSASSAGPARRCVANAGGDPRRPARAG